MTEAEESVVATVAPPGPVIPSLDNLPTSLSWKEKVAFLAHEFSKLPHVPTTLEHEVQDGLYVRTLHIPAGTLLIGRAHRHGHECCLVEGSIILVTPERKLRVDAVTTVHSTPGYHMVLYAITDCIGRTVHPNPTNSHDFDAMENEAFEPVETLMSDGVRVAQRLAYQRMLVAHGVDEDALRPLFMDESDMIPFPSLPRCRIGLSSIDGQGLIATDDIRAGEVIAPARIGTKRTPAGRYANHGFEPNAKMRAKGSDLMLIAVRNIAKDQEITVDYREVVKVAAEPTCQAPH